MPVWSAWLPAGHGARLTPIIWTCQGGCLQRDRGLETWWPRQALGIPPSVHPAARTTLNGGHRNQGLWRQPPCPPRFTMMAHTLPCPMGLGCSSRSLIPGLLWNTREAKIKTFKSVSNSAGTFIPWTLWVRLRLPIPQGSASATLFKGLCHILFKTVLLTFTVIIIFPNYESETYS